MTTATITVTAADIAAGQPACEWGCPIALAILGAIPGIQDVAVHGAGMGVDIRMLDGRVLHAHLPPEARAFIVCFDRRSDLAEPLTFTLDLDLAGVAA